MPADLIVLMMNQFDVILGMDWLYKFHAKIDFFEKTVTFDIPGEKLFQFRCDLIENSWSGFLALIEEREHNHGVEKIPIVSENEVVFHDILGLPPRRVVDFTIDLVHHQYLEHLIEWHLLN